MFNVTRLTAEDVEITEQDGEGRDIRKIYARKAAYVNNEWQLFDIREIYFDEKNGDSRAENISARNYSDFIETPRQMLASNNKDIEGMTSNEIRDYIAQNKSTVPHGWLLIYDYITVTPCPSGVWRSPFLRFLLPPVSPNVIRLPGLPTRLSCLSPSFS